MSDLAHLHLGPGNLGLGLVAATTMDFMDVHLVGREGCPLDPDRLSVTLLGDHGHPCETKQLRVGSLSSASCCDDLDAAARLAIDQAPHLLLTTSLGPAGLRDCADLIVDVVDRRPDKLREETVCIPAEGHPGSAWPALEHELTSRGVDCRATMVSRLCHQPKPPVDRGERVVHAEREAEWLIEGAPDRAVLEVLSQVEHVRFVEDVGAHLLRRRWLVGSGHLASALLARYHHKVHTLDEGDDERFNVAWLREFYKPLVRWFERHHPEFDDTAQYADDHVEMWIRHDYDVQVVLSALRRADLSPFLDDVDYKLASALATVRADGDDCAEMIPVFDALHAILKTFDQYVDGPLLDSGQLGLTIERDQRVVERYEQLVGQVFDAPVAASMANELAAALDQHRARYDFEL